MRQSVHIFRKDVYHLWRELAVYGALLVAFSWVVPQTWIGESATPGSLVDLLAGFLKVVIPILWLVMIVRVVHDESLVGDKQFWVTRPYSRVSLMMAKLGFLVICIVLPFVAMQWVIVLEAGLHPLASMRGLFLSLPSFAEFTWIPFLAVAVVTSSLSRAFMALIGTVVAAWLSILAIGGASGQLMTPPVLFVGYGVLFFCGVIGVLAYQYIARNTKRSRLVLVAMLLVTVGLFGAFVRNYFAGPVGAAVRHEYPVDGSLHLSFDSSPAAYKNQVGRGVVGAGFARVTLPIEIGGLDSAARVHEPNVLFTVDAPGYHYESPWRPARIDGGFSLLVPAEVFNQVHAENVHLHLTLAAERLVPDAPQVVVASDRFSVPDQGNCILLTPGGNLVCRYAFEGPSPTRVTGPIGGACDGIGPPPSQGSGRLNALDPGTRPDPVVAEQLMLGGAVCPGAQLTFVPYHSAGDFRTELDIPNVVLGNYRN